MPNLPDDQYHWVMWQEKGYKTSPQELMPGKKLEMTEGGEYKFEITPEEVVAQKKVCPICKQECVGEFGLNSHMRKHDKK